ncbi:integrase family protein [Ruegeria sp. WL0004]|uniref:Integrase family protein n=2 Tax=Ruegeria marisflavi TaxID=2984152 RepID=A0ABT2WRF2_9RHOB|nr:integrase family protein [Ruegeria sp. WL0004]
MKLSARGLADLPAGQIAWDTEVAGFGARGNAKGQPSMFLNYQQRETGKYKRVTIAKLGESTVDAARKRAAEMRLQIRAGIDPAQQVETPAQKKASGDTLGHWLNVWLDAPHKRWGDTTRRTYRKVITREVLHHDIAASRIERVERAGLMRVVDDVAARSEATGVLLFKILGSFLKWCDTRGVTQVTLPSSTDADLSVDKRKRVLSDAELVRLWRASDAIRQPWSAAAQLVMLTGQRSGAVASLTREQVQQDGVRFINRPNAKQSLPWVPLIAWAWDYLRPSLRPEGRLFTRTAYFSPARLTEWRNAAGVTNWRPHDVRRSLRTWAARQGHGHEASEAALGHSVHKSELESVYQRHDYQDEAAEVIRGWQRHLEALVA